MPLRVHFLNVGRGDCTIIQFPSGNLGVVDIDTLKSLDRDTLDELLLEYRELASAGGLEALLTRAVGEEGFIRKAQAELTDPFAYLKQHVRGSSIFRVVITHPDMDHMTGLDRLSRDYEILNFWHSGPHGFNCDETTPSDWEKSPYAKVDWDTYTRMRQSASMPKSLRKYQSNTGDFWTSDGVAIWAPTPELEQRAVEKDEPNILSMILKIRYKDCSIVLGGDATADETWRAIYPHIDMTGVSVLKASHHGRKSGYHQPSVKEMAPWLTITSVGEKEHDATASYRRYSNYTVSLRKAGDIVITVNDDGRWTYSANVAQHWKPQIR